MREVAAFKIRLTRQSLARKVILLQFFLSCSFENFQIYSWCSTRFCVCAAVLLNLFVHFFRRIIWLLVWWGLSWKNDLCLISFLVQRAVVKRPVIFFLLVGISSSYLFRTHNNLHRFCWRLWNAVSPNCGRRLVNVVLPSWRVLCFWTDGEKNLKWPFEWSTFKRTGPFNWSPEERESVRSLWISLGSINNSQRAVHISYFQTALLWRQSYFMPERNNNDDMTRAASEEHLMDSIFYHDGYWFAVNTVHSCMIKGRGPQ